MKIAFIIHNITRSAGTEKATIQLSNSFAKRGFLVEIISITSGADSKPFFEISPNVVIHHINGFTNKIANFIKIRKVLQDIKPDIIFGTGHNISFFLPFIKNSGSKTIALEHIDFNSIPKLSQALMKFSYSRLNGIVVLSKSAKEKVSKLSDKIVIIPNQIIIGDQESTLLQNRILLVGRISQEKAYERLVPIALKLQNKYPTWKIDIFGGSDDDYKNTLTELIRANNLSNIQINAPVVNIEKEYLRSSVFMITSKFEAFPLVILEAKSYGIPTVGFRNEGTQALIINNEDGFIVDEDDDEAFTKLELLIQDVQLRKKLGNNGRQNVKIYEEDQIMFRWLEFINNLGMKS